MFTWSAGEQLLDLFSHVPTTDLNFDLLKDNPTIGDVAVQATVVPSRCKCGGGSPHGVSVAVGPLTV